MAFEAFKDFGTASESSAAGFDSLVSGLGGIFGTSGSQSGTTEASSEVEAELSGINTDRLEISDEAVAKIVSDILGSEEGLAEIFNEEKVAGIFNSSVSAQASGDLVANIAGEIAKLRAERIQTQDQTQSQTSTSESKTKTKAKDDGLLKNIF